MKKPVIFTPEEKLLLSAMTNSKIDQRKENEIPKGKIDDLAMEVLLNVNSEWDHSYSLDCSRFIERIVQDTLLAKGVRLLVGFRNNLELYIDHDHESQMDIKEVESYISIFHKIRETQSTIQQYIEDKTPVLEIVNFKEETADYRHNMPAYKIVEASNFNMNVILTDPEPIVAQCAVELIQSDEVELPQPEEAIQETPPTKEETFQFEPVLQSSTMLFELA